MSDCIEIPYQQLSEETLLGLMEEFVNREGTDYGEYEYSLDDKVRQLKLALKQGQVVIVFDPISESCTLLAGDGLEKS